MEFEGVYENKIPLDALPAKLQDMVLALARQENYSIEYTLASLLVAASTAIGNAVNICIRGGWISNAAMYMILVGRPGMGKTPPLDFAFRPIRKHDAKTIRKFKEEMEHYNEALERQRGKKEDSVTLPPKPILRRTIISDFTPEALIRAHDDNKRGVVLYVDEIMGMFNAVNQYSINPAKRNVLDLKNETCKNREKRNVLKISHTRHFKTTKKQSKTGCFYSF